MELNKEAMSIIIPIILLIAWFVRLEAKVLFLEKNHTRHEDNAEKMNDKMWLKIDKLSDDMGAIKETLARIEESLKHRTNHEQ